MDAASSVYISHLEPDIGTLERDALDATLKGVLARYMHLDIFVTCTDGHPSTGGVVFST